MTLSDIQNYVFRRTKTNVTSFPVADMAIGLNAGLERVEGLIREYVSNYDATRFTGANITTGTATPKFNSRYHEIIPLWICYQWAVDNEKANARGILTEIQIKEQEMVEFYGLRTYSIFTVTIAAPGVFTRDDHRLQVGDRIILETTGALPTGLSAETWYYVKVVGTDHTFQLASTRTGTVITTSGSQSGTHYFGTEVQKRLYTSADSNK